MAVKLSVESGVLVVFRQHGITDPETAYELLALELARRIDRGIDDRSLAAVTAQLRLTIQDVLTQPSPKASGIDKLIDSQ